ncbi:ketopantoate reductase family protein [Anaerotignum propionicum]|uniref:ketopantoate reductase family protein n=1 Tax=Anaerotignum propionicum TaxID=28446 RepID=UPI0021094DA3|nr:2-dehydropantoate 2-reductase [Anaerotignum propionicum]MCQ4936983.1 2-dehydropantoate 2-reductase [Anaerotignum propionicum]
MKIAILGLGEVGATVAGGLKKYEKNLIFIARGETKRVLREKGLYLESDKLGNQTINPGLVSDDPKEIGTVDVLILCSKSYSLETACKKYVDIIGESTLVVPLQNGIMTSRNVSQWLKGKGVVSDSFIYCFSNIVEVGHVYNRGELLRIGIGFADGKDNEKARQLVSMLKEGGLPSNYGQDIMMSIWEKYAMMCGNSCAFIYYDCEAGDIQKDASKLEFLRGIYEDILRLAKASGVSGLEDMPEKYYQHFLTLPPQTISSLYRDIREGKEETEFEWVIGGGYKLAQEMGISVPYMEKVYQTKAE